MPKSDIESDFPQLVGKYRLSSEIDEAYNCIAWAQGRKGVWVDPCPMAGYEWPDGVPRDGTTADLITLFHLDGYNVCDNPDLENGFEKIAIYGIGQIYEHAARQLEDGKWTSKLGPDEDIEHETLDGLNSILYGEVKYIMKRPRQMQAQS